MADMEDYPLVMALAILWRQDHISHVPKAQSIEDVRSHLIQHGLEDKYHQTELALQRLATTKTVKLLYVLMENGQASLPEFAEEVMMDACGIHSTNS